MDNLSGNAGGWYKDSKLSEGTAEVSSEETTKSITQEEFESRLAIIEDLVDEAEARINELYDLRAKSFLYNAKVTIQSLDNIIKHGS